ncbi:MAG: segregation/condensation protein A [Deltaproteobacteria bacterium]|uniref:Segregation and condensation protein A n=1 Tax=Candidatus Zymogenus saltonus TaxID=2844893 RepID=A0A9D8PND5_9DELT|nr:segregation/condensation protein A [Candidatus Zymogenus saltonus]
MAEEFWEGETYRVRLEIFEGPLDLLLYLVKKNEYDIFDIPIHEITQQYIEHLELMKVLNLDVAGDYLVMASTLAHIKSKMLLPPLPSEDEEEEEDPRMELALRLIEYQKYKEAAEKLDKFDVLMRDVFLKGAEVSLDGGEEVMEDLTIYQLVAAFRKVLMEAPKDTVHEVNIQELSLKQRMAEISEFITERGEVVFEDLFEQGVEKIIIVVTFLALLELIKERIVRIYQAQPFGTIRIFSAIAISQDGQDE